MKESEVKKLIRKHFKRWAYIVEHWGWQFTIDMVDDHSKMPEGTSDNAAAITYCEFKYLDATITIDISKLVDVPEKTIEYVVIHELVHLLVDPIDSCDGIVPLEYTVTTIAKLMQGMRKSPV